MNILGVFPVKEIRTGGDRRYLELMESLAERGNNVFVIMNTLLEYEPQYFTKIALTIPYKRHGFPPGSYIFKREIKKNLKDICMNSKTDIDFIHIHGDMYLASALFLKKALHVPLFYASRNNDIERDIIIRKHGGFKGRQYFLSYIREIINRCREKQIARFAEIITFQSPREMGNFPVRTHCDASKIVFISGNIGLPRCTPEWKNKNSSKQVKKLVYTGSTAPNKGFRELLKVVSLLKKRGYSAIQCYLIMRLENIESINAEIKRLEIEDQVILAGYVEPFRFLADCDLMVYPVLYDAFPDTVLEALHVGCPVIASSVGGLPDMLEYPDLLFEAGNIEEIARRIERCINENDFYMRLRDLCAGRAAVYHFDWAGRFEDTMKAYAER